MLFRRLLLALGICALVVLFHSMAGPGPRPALANPFPIAVAGGAEHTCALTTDGVVKCWGLAIWGLVGDGGDHAPGASYPVNVCQHYTESPPHCTVFSLETDDPRVVNPPAEPMIAAGGREENYVSDPTGHTCALNDTGYVFCWGTNGYGQLGDRSTTYRSTPALVCTFPPYDGCHPLTQVRAIAAGGAHTCAIVADPAWSHRVFCWGRNDLGQMGRGAGSYVPYAQAVELGSDPRISAIAAGGNHNCAASSTFGGARCWGLNSHGQIGDGTNETRYHPVDVPGLEGATVDALTAGENHTCALVSPLQVKCWGQNTYGQLGDGSNYDRWIPVHVLNRAFAIAAGQYHTCAVTSMTEVHCWGRNDHGQLGNGRTADSATPVKVQGLEGIVLSISAGDSHTCAVTWASSNIGVRCWGWNREFQLGDGTRTERHTPVDVLGLSSNPAPRLDCLPPYNQPYPVTLGESAGLRCSYRDILGGDHTCRIGWADGTVHSVTPIYQDAQGDFGTCEDEHTYDAAGTYISQGCVWDAKGQSTCDQFTVSVVPQPIPPTATVPAGYPRYGCTLPPGSQGGTADYDCDGLSDGLEGYVSAVVPGSCLDWEDWDSDDDLLSDGGEAYLGTERCDQDSDGDYIFDGHEILLREAGGWQCLSPVDNDSDDDFLPDFEPLAGLNPCRGDSDRDWIPDGWEWFISAVLGNENPPCPDGRNPDSDNDSYSDAHELLAATDGCNPASRP